MAVRIRDWLLRQRLGGNPFEFWEADREPELSAYFVRPEWFDALMGDPREPRSAVLLAPRGHGKSSHRLQIARLCRMARNDAALVVEIINYDWLLARGLGGVTSERYRQLLARATLQELWDSGKRHPERMAGLTADPQQIVRLHGMIGWAFERAALRFDPPTLPDDVVRQLARRYRLPADAPQPLDDLIDLFAEHYRELGIVDTLRDLVQIAQTMRFASIYVLLDRVDEMPLTEHDVDAVIRLIQPLISDLHTLEVRGIAFKFFLPDYMLPHMTARGVSRINERIPTYTLHWGEDDLLELLSQRMQFYGREAGGLGARGVVTSLQDLCDADTKADELLIQSARGSPRRLILLGKQLIETHCARARTVDDKIGVEVLNGVLKAGGISRLFLHPDGDVLFDGKRQQLTLTPLARTVLEYLWAERPRYVTKEELRRALYPKSQEDDAFYKLITRLREQLEPHIKNSKNYIDFIEGHGFRLVNYEDAPI